MADLNNPNRPVITDLYADVIDTLRENTKRATAGALPATGGAATGNISAPGFTVTPGNFPVWHAGNFTPSTYMPKSGGAFTGGVTVSTYATAPLHPVPLEQLTNLHYVQDAPVNGIYYGRRNAAWEPVAPRTVDDALLGCIMARPVHNGSVVSSWVECNSQVLNKNTYPRLWAWVLAHGQFAANDTDWNNWNWGMFVDLDPNQFRIPYLPGYFVRPVNTTGFGVDVGRVIGSAQAPMVESHTHPLNDIGHAHNYDDFFHDGTQTAPGFMLTSPAELGYGTNPESHFSPTGGTYPANAGITIQPSGGVETRPSNVAYRHFIYAGNPLA